MIPLKLAVACANVYGRRNALACRDAVIHQFDPESDPEGEAPEKNTDSVAAAGCFRMVSLSDYIT